MESHEEKLHKLVLQSKVNETKDVMKRKASEIDKSKIVHPILLPLNWSSLDPNQPRWLFLQLLL